MFQAGSVLSFITTKNAESCSRCCFCCPQKHRENSASAEQVTWVCDSACACRNLDAQSSLFDRNVSKNKRQFLSACWSNQMTSGRHRNQFPRRPNPGWMSNHLCAMQPISQTRCQLCAVGLHDNGHLRHHPIFAHQHHGILVLCSGWLQNCETDCFRAFLSLGSLFGSCNGNAESGGGSVPCHQASC